jgi:hypothetical protein
VSQSANRKSAKCKVKRSISDPDPHSFVSNIFLSQNCPRRKKSSLNLNEFFLSLYLLGEKLSICGFAEVLSPQKKIPQIANKQNLFADRPL